MTGSDDPKKVATTRDICVRRVLRQEGKFFALHQGVYLPTSEEDK